MQCMSCLTKVYLSSMMRITVLSILLFVSCQAEPHFVIAEIVNPSQKSSGEANLMEDGGQVILSWIHEKDSIDILYKSNLTDKSFESPIEVSRSSDWFVNWADFPGLASFQDEQHQLAYWLEMSDSGTYDYDVHISMTADRGASWSPSKVIHNDGISAEHGFVSATSIEEGLLAVWLDGRHMKSAQDTDDTHSHGGGEMTLRSAIVTETGEILQREQIDNRVCECCQTDVVNTACGPIVVYRNRSKHEVRDVYYARYYNTAWTDPKPLYADNWQINGCPVNGPRIASKDETVAAVWFTQANNEPSVKMVISNDCGKTFGDPILIQKGENVMGRLDIEMNGNGIFICQMIQDSSKADIMIHQFNFQGELIHSQMIAQNGLSRKSGFPRLASVNNTLYIAFRDIYSDRIKTLQIL